MQFESSVIFILLSLAFFRCFFISFSFIFAINCALTTDNYSYILRKWNWESNDINNVNETDNAPNEWERGKMNASKVHLGDTYAIKAFRLENVTVNSIQLSPSSSATSIYAPCVLKCWHRKKTWRR